MKKFLIMSLTLMAFALISCGKSDQKKCEEEEGKVWNAETKKCEDEAKYTITNQYTHDTTVTITAGEASITLSNAGGCAIITESQFAALKVQNQYNVVLCDSTNMMVAEDDASAGDDAGGEDDASAEGDASAGDDAGADDDASADDDCKPGNYNVTNEEPRVLTTADAMNDSADCKELGKEAEPAEEEAPAPTTAEDDAQPADDGGEDADPAGDGNGEDADPAEDGAQPADGSTTGS